MVVGAVSNIENFAARVCRRGHLWRSRDSQHPPDFPDLRRPPKSRQIRNFFRPPKFRGPWAARGDRPDSRDARERARPRGTLDHPEADLTSGSRPALGPRDRQIARPVRSYLFNRPTPSEKTRLDSIRPARRRGDGMATGLGGTSATICGDYGDRGKSVAIRADPWSSLKSARFARLLVSVAEVGFKN